VRGGLSPIEKKQDKGKRGEQFNSKRGKDIQGVVKKAVREIACG